VTNKIQIMVVDDNQSTRENIRKLLELESDMDVAYEAASGEEALRKARISPPDIILMDINMPGMDGIAATEAISTEVEQSQIIVVSVQGEQEYLRRAMAAGAKDYLVKPFDGNELLECIRHIYAREQKRREKIVRVAPAKVSMGKIVTVFSTKGGVGKTTVATNLGAALGLDGKTKVGIIDLDLHFGDVALFLNIVPNTTIADLVQDIDHLDGSVLDNYMTRYKDNIRVLAAPFRPEQADSVNLNHLTTIIKEMQYNYDYIIIDTSPTFSEMMLSVLDMSDMLVVITSQDLPTLKNVRLCLEILESLNYSEDKVKVILNRAKSLGGLNVRDAEELLQRKLLTLMPSDGKTVVSAVNQGMPFIVSNPKSQIAQSLFELANFILSSRGDVKRESEPEANSNNGITAFGWMGYRAF